MARYSLNLPIQLKQEAEKWAANQGVSLLRSEIPLQQMRKQGSREGRGDRLETLSLMQTLPLLKNSTSSPPIPFAQPGHCLP